MLSDDQTHVTLGPGVPVGGRGRVTMRRNRSCMASIAWQAVVGSFVDGDLLADSARRSGAVDAETITTVT